MRPPPLYGPAGKCGTNAGAEGHPGEHLADACSAPATVTVEFGCLHEHVFTERKCPPCAAAIISSPAAVCSACWEGWGGIPRHQCRLLGRITTGGQR